MSDIESENIVLRINDQIIEATENLSLTKLPVYYKYRYTFKKEEDTIDDQKRVMKYFVTFIKQNYLLGEKLIAGIEHFTKGMISTKPHIHIHFISRHSSDTIRKGIMRRFELIGRVQCCKAEVLVDEGKFWRYPLKQQQGDTKRGHLAYGFSQEEVIQMRDVAYECWKQAAEISVGKMERKLEKTSRDRLFAYLDQQQELTERICARLAYEYYVEHEDNFNYNTVNGYIHIYLLKNKIVTYEQFLDTYYKKV